MADGENRLASALRIIEDYPNLHMGPTVPFVLGALQQPIGVPPESSEAAREQLRALLTTLRAAPRRRGVRVQWCGNIRAYVATSMPFVNGLAWDVQGCDPNDFDGLVDTLWQLYGPFITDGEYSIDDFLWHRLSASEIRTIEELLG